jgi:hypothetical protein
MVVGKTLAGSCMERESHGINDRSSQYFHK